MATFNWVYNASWDLVADGTPKEPGSAVMAAFNLNGICWQPVEGGGKPEWVNLASKDTDATEMRVLFPWKANYKDKTDQNVKPVLLRGFADDDFALYSVDAGTGTLTSLTDAGVLKRVLPPADDHIQEKCAATMREIFGTQLSRQRELSVLVEADALAQGVQKEVADKSWSALVGGASMQGWPFAHLLDLAYWLRSAEMQTRLEASKDEWCVVLPKRIFDWQLEKAMVENKIDEEDLPLRVTYKAANGGPDILLRINARKPAAQGALAAERPFVGFAQTIHSGMFSNWLSTLPQTAWRFFDRAWLLRRSGVTAAQKKLIFDQHESVRQELQKAEAGRLGVPVASVLAALSGTLKQTDAGADVLLSAEGKLKLEPAKKALETCRTEISSKLVLPALEAFRATVGMGWTRPFWSHARDEGKLGGGDDAEKSELLYADSLAQTLFLAVNARSTRGMGGEDPRPMVNAILAKAAKAAPLAITVWACCLREALKDVDSDGEGGSHSGHYTEVFELLRYLTGGDTPSFVEAELLGKKPEDLPSATGRMKPLEDEEVLRGEKPGELLERHWLRALEQLSRALEDEEVLRRLFCKHWDMVLADVMKNDAGMTAKVKAVFGLDDESLKKAQPLYGDKRSAVAEAMQELNLQFGKSLGDEVTSQVIHALQGVLEKERGKVIYNAMQWLTTTDEETKKKAGSELAPAAGDDRFVGFVKKCAPLVKDAPLPKQGIEPDAVPALRSQMLLAAALVGKLWFQWCGADADPQGLLKDGDELAAMLCTGFRLPSAQKDAAVPDEQSYWRLGPWVQAVVGADRMRDFLGAPPPLPVPLIVPPAEYDTHRHCGVLMLGRREDTVKGTTTGWYLLNVGDPVFLSGKSAAAWENKKPQAEGNAENALLDEIDMDYLEQIGHRPKAGGKALVVPAVQQPAEVSGVLQAIVEYRGQPLGVTKWDDVQDNPASNYSPAGTDGLREPDIPQRMERWQIVSGAENYNGWVAVPGLRYGRQFRYHFLFAPVQNTGALPVTLRDGAEPGLVWQRGNGELPPDAAAEAKAHQITVVNYVRRVPVQQVRIAAPGQLRGPYKDVEPLFVPEGVKTLCADLETRARSTALPAVRAPATTLLLRNKSSYSEVKFVARPPATSIENWSIWQAAALDEAADDTKKLNVQDCLADMQRLARELGTSTTPTADKLLGLELTQLLDDPAVVGVQVKVSVALDLRGKLATQWSAPPPIILDFTMKPLAEYEATLSDPRWSEHTTLPAATRENCRRMAQTATEEELTIAWGRYDSEVALQNGRITVPEGCVVEITLIPCIEKAVYEQRFGIYENPAGASAQKGDAAKRDLTDLGSLGKAGWYAVEPAVYRIWAESVPHQWYSGNPSSEAVAAYLPAASRVWKALQLGPVGTAAGDARLIQSLEVSLLPGISANAGRAAPDLEEVRRRQELCSWAFVSSVRAEIQPWSWRGLPEGEPNGKGSADGERDALSALVQADFPFEAQGDGVARDELQEVLMAQVRGEAPGFGEREEGASRVKDREVNYATSCLRALQGDAALLQELPVEIIDEGGDQQEEVPRYYRVRLVATSRYAVLGQVGGDSQSIVNHKRTAISAYDWKWKEEKKPEENRRSHHRRALMRGQLKLRPDPPRVKMVIPLLEALESHGCARPGFIVVTRDTLRSPWHRFVGEIEWAKVNASASTAAVTAVNANASSGGDQLLESIEFAPDGITDPQAFDLAFKSRALMRAKSRLEGKAFGLTYERESSNPLFPNAGFYFAAPDMDITKSHESHDWFAKVAFHWEIGPGCVMDNDAEMLRGQTTQPWQVRLLAPFRMMSFGDSNNGTSLEEVTFAEKSGNTPKLVFWKNNKNILPTPRPPDFRPGSSTGELAAKAPDALLLFITWSLVPDFLTAESSKIAHSIYIFTGQEKTCKRVFLNEMAQRSDLKPQGGNFVLLFGRHGDVQAVTTKLGETNSKFGFEDLVDQFLFPLRDPGNKSENQIERDARLVITRCSAAIKTKP